MDRTDSKNVTSEKSGDDFDFYLKNDIPPAQVKVLLRYKKMGDDQIDKFVDKLVEARERVQKHARKFMTKIEQHYGHLETEKIIQKAYKFAKKNQLSEAEADAVVKLALKGDVYSAFGYLNELKHTPMSKFLGIDNMAGQVLKLGPKDQAPLMEIVKMFEMTRPLYNDIKNQTALYRDCAPEALNGVYDNTKHNLSTHIHPVVVALFLPKIQFLERRMLATNLGRVIISRAQPYINKQVSLYDNILPRELETELELTFDISNDPNSLAYFSDDSPIANLAKRFKIQIELWRNVLNLRQGRFYSVGYDENDGINGFMRALSQYDWAYFDSPDMYNVQDEGTVLRKILSVFSLRPTLAQVSSLVHRQGAYTGLARSSFLQIPIINIRLPAVLQNGIPTGVGAIDLATSFNQDDWYIENKMIVPKNKTVIFSRELAFFYANRRNQSVNVANIQFGFRYSNLPMQQWNVGQATVNETDIIARDNIPIGRDNFQLRSVVCVYRPPIQDYVAVGCNALVVCPTQYGAPRYFDYNPLMANRLDPVNGAWVGGTPIGTVPRTSMNSADYTFDMAVRRFGTVFLYVRV